MKNHLVAVKMAAAIGVGLLLSGFVSGGFSAGNPREQQQQDPGVIAWIQPHWWTPLADLEDYGNVIPVRIGGDQPAAEAPHGGGPEERARMQLIEELHKEVLQLRKELEEVRGAQDRRPTEY